MRSSGALIHLPVRQLLRFAGTAVGLARLAVRARVTRAEVVAAGKLTKPAWAGITGLAALVEFSMTPFALFGVPFAGFLWLPGIVAAIVYLVDVRPAVRGLRRGNSW